MDALSSENNIIRCDMLQKRFNVGTQAIYALKDVSIEIDRGEYVAIVGHSGSGKSTLMNIIGLIDSPTSGEYFFEGKRIDEYKEKELAAIRNQKIGYIFQSFFLEPKYDVYKNVEMPLLIAGVPRKERKERILAAIERVGMSHRLRNRGSSLSGGEKQRVAIARALVCDPCLILADEPCGNLDTVNSAEIMKILSTLHKEGRTVILITHNNEDSMQAQRRITMKDGQIVL